MGSAVGAACRAGGARILATLAGRSERTAKLAGVAALELLPDLEAVVRDSQLVLSIVPPGDALAVAADVAAAAGRRGRVRSWPI